MKKLLFLLALVSSFIVVTPVAVNAQQPVLMPLVAGDTVVNAGAVNKVFTVTAGYSVVGIQFVLTKISGLVAGTTTPQVSLDGTNYITLPGATAHTNTDVTTNTNVWYIAGGVPWKFIRVRSVGTGTMSAQLRVYYVLRKHD